MARISAAGRFRSRVALAEDARIPFFTLLLATAIACSALLMPTTGNAQDLAASRAGTSPGFEQTAWGLISNSKDPADFETYLQIYPNGRFNLAARERLAELSAPPRKNRGIVLAPAASTPAPAAPKAQSAKAKLAASRPLTPPRKKPYVAPAPVAYVPVPAPPQTPIPAARPAEAKRVTRVASQPVTEAEPVDPLDCAMGGMDPD